MINIWIAPILPFTAEEVYQSLDDKKFESIFLEEWSTDKSMITDDEKVIGDMLFSLKHLVSKELDEARNKELIGSSLDATLQLNVDKETYNILLKYLHHFPTTNLPEQEQVNLEDHH